MKQSIDRIVDILELLADHSGGLAVTEIALQLDIPSSGAHRIVTLLARRGLVEQDLETRVYRLTLKFATIGLRLLSGASFHTVVQPILDRYGQDSAELVRLAVAVEDGRLTWIANAQGARSQLRVDPIAGHTVVPHLTAAGKAWLAAMSDTEAERVMARELYSKNEDRGPRAIRSGGALLRDLAHCRQKGYAVTVDEIEVGLSAVAAAVTVPSADGRRAVAAISVAGPTVRMPPEQIKKLGVMMIAAAEELASVWDLLGEQIGKRDVNSS